MALQVSKMIVSDVYKEMKEHTTYFESPKPTDDDALCASPSRSTVWLSVSFGVCLCLCTCLFLFLYVCFFLSPCLRCIAELLYSSLPLCAYISCLLQSGNHSANTSLSASASGSTANGAAEQKNHIARKRPTASNPTSPRSSARCKDHRRTQSGSALPRTSPTKKTHAEEQELNVELDEADCI